MYDEDRHKKLTTCTWEGIYFGIQTYFYIQYLDDSSEYSIEE